MHFESNILKKPINLGVLNYSDEKCYVMNFDNGIGTVIKNEEDIVKLIRKFETKKIEITNSEKSIIVSLIKKNIISLKSRKVINKSKNATTVYLGVTDKCNYRCLYCYGDFKAGSETEEFDHKKLVSQIQAQYSIGSVVLTGGEPLMQKKTFEVIDYLNTQKIPVSVISNGSLVTDEAIKGLKGIKSIQISLDGPDAKTNDITRGQGSFNRTIAGIKKLCNEGFVVNVNTVLNKYNVNKIEEIYALTYEMGVKNHKFSECLPFGSYTEKLCLSSREIEKINNTLTECRLSRATTEQLTSIQRSLLTGEIKRSCGMGINEVFINYKGNIYPCRMCYSDKYQIGNIFDSSKKLIDEKLHAITKKFDVDMLECSNCEIKYYCGGGCRMAHMAYTGNEEINHQDLCNTLKRQCIRLSLLKVGLIDESSRFTLQDMKKIRIS